MDFFADADVARDEVALLQRHVELRALGKFQHEHVLVVREPAQLLEARDAVLQMNDEFAFDQLAEINLRTAHDFTRTLQRDASRARVAVAAKEFRIAEHGDLPRRKCKAAPERADGEMQRVRLDRGNQVVQPLDLALVVAKDERAPALRAPLGELREEPLAPRLVHDEIAGLKFTEAIFEKRE